jgi:general secretion pathway protein H
MRRPPVTARPAYTLVEVLLVIVMLGIASALVVPSLGTTDVLRIQAAVRTIVADINYAQSDALARQRGRAVVFDVPNNRYSIVMIPVGASTLDPAVNTMQSVNFSNTYKYNDARLVSASFDGGSPNLIFDEMGGPVTAPGGSTPGNGGLIVVSGSRSVFNITIEPYTGRVTVTRMSGP